MSESRNCIGGENVPSIPSACATHNFTHLARGPWSRPYTFRGHHGNWYVKHTAYWCNKNEGAQNGDASDTRYNMCVVYGISLRKRHWYMIFIKRRYVIIDPYPSFNNGSLKMPLKVGHRLAIASIINTLRQRQKWPCFQMHCVKWKYLDLDFTEVCSKGSN